MDHTDDRGSAGLPGLTGDPLSSPEAVEPADVRRAGKIPAGSPEWNMKRTLVPRIARALWVHEQGREKTAKPAKIPVHYLAMAEIALRAMIEPTHRQVNICEAVEGCWKAAIAEMAWPHMIKCELAEFKDYGEGSREDYHRCAEGRDKGRIRD